MTQRSCSIRDCERPHKGHGFCNRHLYRWRRYGDPLQYSKRTEGVLEPDAKRCLHCDVVFPATEAHFQRHDSGRLRNVCIPCFRIQQERSRQKRDPGRKREFESARPYWIDYQLQKNYGLTFDGFTVMSAKQGHACLLCGDIPDGKFSRSRLNIDHDHDTGEIRGLLCNPCNVGIGHFKDDPTLLRRAATYLEKGHPDG